MSKLTKALTAAAGNAGGDNLYAEDVFSTYLYEGSGAARTIANGIPLSDEGGLVWLKQRGALDSHVLFDTVNGPQKSLASNDTAAGANYSSYLSFPSAGTAGWNLAGAILNGTGTTWASWTFRKAEKFFDVVTYTGDGVAGRTVSHNLGSVPACMIVKCTTTSSTQWLVYHESLGNTKYLTLNTTNAAGTTTVAWNDTSPTSSEFTVGTSSSVNAIGDTYVAYLFASDAGGFGDDGSENIIKCGSYTGDGSTNHSISVGFEPQWLMIKHTSGAGNPWAIYDSMRGTITSTTTNDIRLEADSSSAEIGWPDVAFTADGFKLESIGSRVNTNTENYIYIAIRRPMKTPEAGTEVFDPNAYTATANSKTLTTGFPVDLFLGLQRNGTAYKNVVFDRFRGTYGLNTATTNADEDYGTNYALSLDDNEGFTDNNLSSGMQIISYAFKRATGFMDVVCGTASGYSINANHNLGVVPELIISKNRDISSNWYTWVASLSTTQTRLALNSTQASVNTGYPINYVTDTTFFAATAESSTASQVFYLFATLAGVSKVGSYTGTGSNLNVDCGFSAGARFILIKRTDSTGDWYVWDSARGIVAGNDPYLLLNSTAAEVTNTDYIDPLASGFTVTSSAPAALNASGGNYIFLAIA